MGNKGRHLIVFYLYNNFFMKNKDHKHENSLSFSKNFRPHFL